MAIKVQDILNTIDGAAPFSTQEEWDNSGLNIGDSESEVTGILLSLDVTEEVLEEAVKLGYNVIVSHHPMIFSYLKNFTEDNLLQRKIRFAIRNGINLISSHTNLDKSAGGMNDTIMEILGLDDIRSLGDFGRVGSMEETGLRLFLDRIKENLCIESIRFTGDLEEVVSEVAVINGSGADFIDLCRESGIRTIITGDLKFHEMKDGEEEGLNLIDAGHFGTEDRVYRYVMTGILKDICESHGISMEYSESNKDPFRVI